MNNLNIFVKDIALLLAVLNRNKEKDARALSAVLSLNVVLSVIQLIRTIVALRKENDSPEN